MTQRETGQPGKKHASLCWQQLLQPGGPGMLAAFHVAGGTQGHGEG